MVRTELRGFPVQYGEDVVKHLNRVYSERPKNNADLREIGRAVSPTAKHILHGRTADDYIWFGTLEYRLGSVKVVVLFPWSQDWDSSRSQMDRSINVYSDKKLPNEVVGDLIENIGYQMALHRPFRHRI
jgi:hypothetical protein